MQMRQERGYTLVEMLVVIGLLALIAAVAAPALQTTDTGALERDAERVATAMRFAHAEALRTGEKHGVIANTSTQLIDVYRLDEEVNPPVVVYDIYDPVTKQPYRLDFSSSGETKIAVAEFKFDGNPATLAFVGFSGATGVPSYADTSADLMLDYGFIRLSHDGVSRTVSVSPMTARVTVQ